MKIDDIYNKLAYVGNSPEALANKKAEDQTLQERGPEKQNGAGDEVDFSKTSVEVSRAAAIVEKDAMERSEKVNQIKTQVANGTYEIDATKVADKILEDVLSDLVEP